MEVATGAMVPQAKEFQGFRQTSGTGGGRETLSPRTIIGGMVLPTPWFWTSDL